VTGLHGLLVTHHAGHAAEIQIELVLYQLPLMTGRIGFASSQLRLCGRAESPAQDSPGQSESASAALGLTSPTNPSPEGAAQNLTGKICVALSGLETFCALNPGRRCACPGLSCAGLSALLFSCCQQEFYRLSKAFGINL
jgi:hypothetical protein